MEKLTFVLNHLKGEIRSFPTMYNTWRFIWSKWAKMIIFSKKSCFLDMVLDHLTSEVTGAQNFKGIDNFHMGHMGHKYFHAIMDKKRHQRCR